MAIIYSLPNIERVCWVIPLRLQPMRRGDFKAAQNAK